MNWQLLYEAAPAEEEITAEEGETEEFEMEIKLSYDTLAESGAIMLKGMAGIFVVIGVIILVVFILNAIFRPKKEA